MCAKANNCLAVTASTDEVGKVGACFLQLKLVIDRGNQQRESVLMGRSFFFLSRLPCAVLALIPCACFAELSLPQFYQFLQQMQAASRHVQQAS